MNKLLTFTAAAVLMTAPAFAEDKPADAPHDGPPHHGKMFDKADADGDGVITKEEFVAESTKRFEEMDADKDGKVTKEEAEAKREAMRAKWKEKRAERMKERSGDAGAPAEAPAEPPAETAPAE